MVCDGHLLPLLTSREKKVLLTLRAQFCQHIQERRATLLFKYVISDGEATKPHMFTSRYSGLQRRTRLFFTWSSFSRSQTKQMQDTIITELFCSSKVMPVYDNRNFFLGVVTELTTVVLAIDYLQL